MQKTISGQEGFQVMAHSFAVSPSNQTYTLAYSVDGVHFTRNADSTPAGQNLIVNSVPKGVYWRLEGNTTDVIITY